MVCYAINSCYVLAMISVHVMWERFLIELFFNVHVTITINICYRTLTYHNKKTLQSTGKVEDNHHVSIVSSLDITNWSTALNLSYETLIL